MLSNTRIRQLVHDSHLISEFNENSLKHCSYKLRIGKLILPGTAALLDSTNMRTMDLNGFQKCIKWLSDKFLPNQHIEEQTAFRLVNNNCELKPNELIIFQTKEQVCLPMDVSASYSALDSIAKQGLLLINASIVEPGYQGYLSGVLLNFSSKSFMLKPDMEIVKINFYQVDGEVEHKVNESIGDIYTEVLQKTAQHYTHTFLDVEGIKKEVMQQTSEKVSRSIKFGGWILALLLAFCTIEPVLYKYFWYDSWTPINSTYIETERSIQYQKQMEVIDSLSKRIDSLQIKLEKQDAKKSDPKSKGRL